MDQMWWAKRQEKCWLTWFGRTVRAGPFGRGITQEGNSVDAWEVTSAVTGELAAAIGHKVSDSKKGYTDLVKVVEDGFRTGRHESEAINYSLDCLDANITGLELKVQLLTGNVSTVPRFEKLLTAKNAKSSVVKEISFNLNTSSALIIRSQVALRSKHDLALAAICNEDCRSSDFAKSACTGY